MKKTKPKRRAHLDAAHARPDPEGMTWMQADGRMRRQVERPLGLERLL